MSHLRRSGGKPEHMKGVEYIDYTTDRSLSQDLSLQQITTACEADDAEAFAEAYQDGTGDEATLRLQGELPPGDFCLEARKEGKQQKTEQEIPDGVVAARSQDGKTPDEERNGADEKDLLSSVSYEAAAGCTPKVQEVIQKQGNATEVDGAQADELTDQKQAKKEQKLLDGEQPADSQREEEDAMLERQQQQEKQQQEGRSRQQREAGEQRQQEEEKLRQKEEEERRQQEQEKVRQQGKEKQRQQEKEKLRAHEEEEQRQKEKEKFKQQDDAVQQVEQEGKNAEFPCLATEEPIGTLQLAATDIAAGEMPQKREEPDDERMVAEETQAEPHPEYPGLGTTSWPSTDAEFSASAAADTFGASFITGLANDVCEEVFVSGNGRYGPPARTRVFNEALYVVRDRIPAAATRYIRQARRESVADACLSCTEDVSQSCFPAMQLLLETIVASGAAVCSFVYTNRKEILNGMNILSNAALNCLKTCICSVMPPPQGPRRGGRPPPAPWTSVETLPEVWGLSEDSQTAHLNPQQCSEWLHSSMHRAGLPRSSPREDAQRQEPHTLCHRLQPLMAGNSGRLVFSKRNSGNS